MNCTNIKLTKDNIYDDCNGEMGKIGNIDNTGIGLGMQTIYQCSECKTIQII